MGVMIDSQLPYLVAMDDDILSTGVCIFHLKVRAIPGMRGSRKFCQRGSNFELLFFIRGERIQIPL